MIPEPEVGSVVRFTKRKMYTFVAHRIPSEPGDLSWYISGNICPKCWDDDEDHICALGGPVDWQDIIDFTYHDVMYKRYAKPGERPIEVATGWGPLEEAD